MFLTFILKLFSFFAKPVKGFYVKLSFRELFPMYKEPKQK